MRIIERLTPQPHVMVLIIFFPDRGHTGAKRSDYDAVARHKFRGAVLTIALPALECENLTIRFPCQRNGKHKLMTVSHKLTLAKLYQLCFSPYLALTNGKSAAKSYRAEKRGKINKPTFRRTNHAMLSRAIDQSRSLYLHMTICDNQL